MSEEIVALVPSQTLVVLLNETRSQAIDIAFRVTMSEHEWRWTDIEAATMASYVLWAHQRLSGIGQLVDGGLDRIETSRPAALSTPATRSEA